MAISVPAYADTSFLVSLYGNDAFSPAARATVRKDGLPILLCDLNRLEFENAMRLMRFRKLVAARFVQKALAAFQTDTQAGLLQAAPIDWPLVFDRASRISARRTMRGGHRTMDILHVAIARIQQAKRFYSFDTRQRALARQEGMRLNDNTP